MTLSARLRARDSYGVLFVLIVAALFASTVPIGSVGTVLRTLTIAAVLVFALRTSGASRIEVAAAAVVGVAGAMLSLPFERGSRIDRALASGASLILALGVLAAIARRIGTHPVVSGATIAAALCVYLMMGIAFAAAYGLVGAIDEGAVFSGRAAVDGDGTSLEHTYFSFSTITTVGFGDLVPATDVTRMLAVTEAFTGQLYLVTVVAVLVGNIGRDRRGRRDHDGPPERRPG